jgi:hypothetical protein
MIIGTSRINEKGVISGYKKYAGREVLLILLPPCTEATSADIQALFSDKEAGKNAARLKGTPRTGFNWFSELTFTCPDCGTQIHVPRTELPKYGRCPKCERALELLGE